MSALIRLLEAAAIFRPVIQGVAMRQALPKIIQLAIVGVITCIIASAVIMLGFYAVHLELSLNGYSEEQALVVTVCVALMTLIICVLWLRRSIAHFKDALLPKPKGVAGIFDSFMEGLHQSAPANPEKEKAKPVRRAS